MTDKNFHDGVWSKHQFRMIQLQVKDWGTFSGVHTIPISKEGFLLIGNSGSGKSTLLDAITALMVPSKWREFNAAAKKGEKGRGGRSWVSYIRGEWGEQIRDGAKASAYLRKDSTWTALVLEFSTDAGKMISLVQIHILKGSTCEESSVHHYYFIHEGHFDIREKLKDLVNVDLKSIKQLLPDTRPFESFDRYSENFRRLLNINSEVALRLLHKTQSAKNIGGDLNVFLREYMLDEPETFDYSDNLVSHFSALKEAHQSVLIVREQVEILKPARDEFARFQADADELVKLNTIRDYINIYAARKKIDLLKDRLQELMIEEKGLEGQEKLDSDALNSIKLQMDVLKTQQLEHGGAKIEELERLNSTLKEDVGRRKEKSDFVTQKCRTLGKRVPKTPHDLAQLTSDARFELEHKDEAGEKDHESKMQLMTQIRDLLESINRDKKEIRYLELNPSNIPGYMLELRSRITTALKLSEQDLPFVGEQLEVKKSEEAWRGALERLLKGFSLSLLVDENKHYSAILRYVNENNLKGRILNYYRVTQNVPVSSKEVRPRSSINKLEIKETSYRAAIEYELRDRYNFTCVESLGELKQTEFSMTKEGQIRYGKARHTKDDRFDISDKEQWFMGFDNREKREHLAKRVMAAEKKLKAFSDELAAVDGRINDLQNRLLACQAIANVQWHEIDVAGVLDAIAANDEMLNRLKSNNRELQEIVQKIETLKPVLDAADEKLRRTKADRTVASDRIKETKDEIALIETETATTQIAEEYVAYLDARFSSDSRRLTLKNIDPRKMEVYKALESEIDSLKKRMFECRQQIEKRFARFLTKWEAYRNDLQDSIQYAPEFMKLLDNFELDDLPKHAQRFFEMWKDRSMENLAALNEEITNARKSIRMRMDIVNESLHKVPFNEGTYIQISTQDRYIKEVADFRADVLKLLDHAWDDTEEDAEKKFMVLSAIVDRLKSEETTDVNWKNTVLDVRNHVEFLGREYFYETGNEVEVYSSGGKKSGGQQEKLATTCLAAALRYQLAGSDEEPLYAPVIIDEAFANSDNEFTKIVMRIFNSIGFQMIVATPLQKVMALEQFIGGACFVSIEDRMYSSVINIEYDNTLRKLKIGDRKRKELEVS